jgi:hypothetical protein
MMFGTHVIMDMQRLAAREALNARPNAPVEFDPAIHRSVGRFRQMRLAMTLGLRRLADAMEPTAVASPALSVSAPTSNQGCTC